MESQGYSGLMSVGKTLLEDGNAVFGSVEVVPLLSDSAPSHTELNGKKKKKS